jgi:hypothetical protein
MSSSLRSRILAIHGDKSLSSQEKTRRVQRLTMNPALTDEEVAASSSSSSSSSSSAKSSSDVSSVVVRDSRTAESLKGDMRPGERETVFQSDGVLGCVHYQRGCKYLAECCGRWFPCRLCHDAEQSHGVDRYATKWMYCMHCQTVQPWATACGNKACGAVLGAYTCGVCKFHDSTPNKDIYHCGKCGMCRVGKGLGVDYFHCDRCGVCMSVEMRDHVCIEKNLNASCPICGEYMHTSVKSVVFMNCGHAIHRACLLAYQRTNFVCPTCSRSIFDDMRPFWDHFAQVIASQPMPVEFARARAKVMCNDCSERSSVPFHFVGHRCRACRGFNTRVLSSKHMPTFDATGGMVAPPPADTDGQEASSDDDDDADDADGDDNYAGSEEE